MYTGATKMTYWLLALILILILHLFIHSASIAVRKGLKNARLTDRSRTQIE